MNHPLLKKIFKMLEKLRWQILVVAGAILILFVVMMALLRLALPYLSDYQEDIEQYLSRELQRKILVKQIDADWHWFSPRLKLIDVSIADKDGRSTFLRLDEISFEFGLIDNLTAFSFEPTVITLSGGVVLLKKDKQGQVYLQSRPLMNASGSGASSDGMLNDIAAQLNNKEIHVVGIEVHWTDLNHSRVPLVIKQVNTIVKVLDDKFQVLVDAKTPEKMGKSLMIKADIRRDQKPDEREFSLYINASRIKSDYVYRYIPDPGVKIKTVIDTETWLRFKGKALQELSGILAADEIIVSESEGKNKHQWVAKNLNTKFQLNRRDELWSLTLDKLNMDLDQHQWRDVYLTSRINMQTSAIKLRCDKLYLQDVADLVRQLPVGNKIKQVINKYNPAGVLTKTNIEINDWARTKDWVFKTRFEDLGISLESGKINLKGVSGSLGLEKDSGWLKLKSQNIVFASEYFNQPVQIDSLYTDIQINTVNQVKELKADKIVAVIDGVKASARLKYIVSDERHLDLHLTSRSFSAGWFKNHRSDYFLGKKTSDWIAKAARDASLDNLNLVIHGSLNEIPFRKNTGVLQANFEINHGVLKFAEDWPEVRNLNGTFSYDNEIIKISDSSGQIFNSHLSDTLTTVDLRQTPVPHVIIVGKVQTTADELGRFFEASPLEPDYQKLTSSVSVQANIKSDLRIDVPLNEEPVAVSGDADIGDGLLTVEKPRYVVSEIKGDLRFANTDIFSNRLSGMFNGHAVVAEINTRAFKTTKQTTVNARFISDLSALFPFGVSLDSISQDNTGWLMNMGLLHTSLPGVADMKVTISSELDGMALRLPYPLNKKADEKISINADFNSFADASELMVHCNSKFNLHMLWKENFEWLRSDIRIQDGPVKLLRPGLNISAKVDEVDLVQWERFLDKFETDKPGSGEINLNSLTLNTSRLQYQDYQLSNVNLQTKPDAVKLIFDISADEFVGEVELYPSFSKDKPVEVNFSKLRLSSLVKESPEKEKIKNSTDERLSPVLVPPLKISGEDFTYKDYHFDTVNLETSRSRYGMTIHALDLKSEHLDLKAKGSWFIKQDRHQSSFRVELSSDDAGGMLTAYNLTKSMKKGSGQAVINWQWPASPFDFDWKLVSGSMQLDLADGRFVDVEPGAGRLLGMFSLSSLPKRFLLDFSDTFSEGFEFNELTSQGNFIDGSLYTNKTIISGSSADIYFNRRVGLANRDYDLIMSVVPRISSGVSGWIAVLQGAAVGLTAYLGQKILGVDEAAKNQYHITGSWNEPVIKKIGGDKKASEKNVQETESD